MMKKWLCIVLTIMLVCSACTTFAERSVEGMGTPVYEHEYKAAYDEMFDMMGLPYGQFMEYLGAGNFDLSLFINSEYGEITGKHGQIFMKYDDNMDSALLEHYRAQDLEKVMFTGEDASNVNEHYYVFVPVERGEGEVFPVVIVNHGGGATARTTELYGWTDIASREKLILIMTEDTSAPFLHQALDNVRQHYPVDNSRIYVTGTSAGGMASKAFAAAYPNEVAAIAPLDIGWILTDADGDVNAMVKNTMPMIFITGTADMYHSLPIGYTGMSTIDGWNNLLKLTGYEAYTLTDEESKQLVEKSLNLMESYTGVKLPEPEVRSYVNNRAFISRFVNEEKVNTLSVVVVENKIHMPVGYDVEIAWEFLQQFARNTETGELIIR